MIPADASRHVLIVEDDADFAESLADLLELRGFRAVVAGTVEAAMAAAAGTGGDDAPPAVALIDLRLGATSGIDLLARSRR